MKPSGSTVSRRMLLTTASAAALAARARAEAPPQPLPPNAVLLRRADFRWDAPSGLHRVAVPAPPGAARRPLIGSGAERSAADRLLATLLRRGRAAGNDGDLYDNRDRGHSRARPDLHPRVAFLIYAEDARAAGFDHGLNSRILFDGPTIGNASLAVAGGPFWRSLPRAAMTEGDAVMARVGALHRANHLYVHPAHRDHDPENGDVFPAATPHWVNSQGSSGSDRAFVAALLDALAALRPDTKARLAAHGLIAPTLQMLLRRSMAGIETDVDYLSAAAHPSAFDGARIDRERLIRAANALAPGGAPPPPRLAVTAEAAAADLPGEGLSERLFDTPEAVARVAHGASGLRRYRLQASVPDDSPGPTRFVWRVLRGPGATVAPVGPDGAEAEVSIPWIAPYPDVRTGLRTTRVDVAVFAEAAGALSAPAFFSVAFPADRRGEWAPDGRPLVVEHGPPSDGGYVDPALFPRRDWRDVYQYDADGRLLGWSRERADGARDAYTRHGLRVVERDALGRPARAEIVVYRTQPPQGGVRRLVEEGAGRFAAYAYADDADRLGVARPAP